MPEDTDDRLDRILYSQCVVYAQQEILMRYLFSESDLDAIFDQVRVSAEEAYQRQKSMIGGEIEG